MAKQQEKEEMKTRYAKIAARFRVFHTSLVFRGRLFVLVIKIVEGDDSEGQQNEEAKSRYEGGWNPQKLQQKEKIVTNVGPFWFIWRPTMI